MTNLSQYLLINSIILFVIIFPYGFLEIDVMKKDPCYRWYILYTYCAGTTVYGIIKYLF